MNKIYRGDGIIFKSHSQVEIKFGKKRNKMSKQSLVLLLSS